VEVVGKPVRPPTPSPGFPDSHTDSVVEERWRRVKVHQRADPALKQLIWYLEGDLHKLKKSEAKKVARVADQYELDVRGVLHFVSYSPEKPSSEP